MSSTRRPQRINSNEAHNRSKVVPVSPCAPHRLSPHAFSAKVKWEGKHGKPCPYALPAGEGCPYTRRDTRMPLCAQGDNSGRSADGALSGLSIPGSLCIDFGSGFNRDFDGVAWQEDSFQPRGGKRAATVPAAERGEDVALTAVVRGVGSCKRNAGKGPGRRRRAPTLLQIHEHVIKAALIELARPREKAFENLGERLGGEHNTLPRDTAILPACAAEGYSSPGSSRASSRLRGGQNRALRRLQAADEQRPTLSLPRFKEHDPWKIPLLRSESPTEGGSRCTVCDTFDDGDVEFCRSGPELPDRLTSSRQGLADRSLASYPTRNLKLSSNGGRKRPRTADVTGRRGEGSDGNLFPADRDALGVRTPNEPRNSGGTLPSEVAQTGTDASTPETTNPKLVYGSASRAPGYEEHTSLRNGKILMAQSVEAETPTEEDAGSQGSQNRPAAHQERQAIRPNVSVAGGVIFNNTSSVDAGPLASMQHDDHDAGDDASLAAVGLSGEAPRAVLSTTAEEWVGEVVLQGRLTWLDAAFPGACEIARPKPAATQQDEGNGTHSGAEPVVMAMAEQFVNELVSQGIFARMASTSNVPTTWPYLDSRSGAAPVVRAMVEQCVNDFLSQGVWARMASASSVYTAKPDGPVNEAKCEYYSGSQVARAVENSLPAELCNREPATAPKGEGEGALLCGADMRAVESSALAKHCIDEEISGGMHAQLFPTFDRGIHGGSTGEASGDATLTGLSGTAKGASNRSSTFYKQLNVPRDHYLPASGGIYFTMPLSSPGPSVEYALSEGSSVEAGPSKTGMITSQDPHLEEHRELNCSSIPSNFSEDLPKSGPCALHELGGDFPADGGGRHWFEEATRSMSVIVVEGAINRAVLAVTALSMEGAASRGPGASPTPGEWHAIGRAETVSMTAITVVEELILSVVVKTAYFMSSPPPAATPAASLPRHAQSSPADAEADGDNHRDNLGSPAPVAPAIPSDFLEALLANRECLKPVPKSKDIKGENRVLESRPRRESAEAIPSDFLEDILANRECLKPVSKSKETRGENRALGSRSRRESAEAIPSDFLEALVANRECLKPVPKSKEIRGENRALESRPRRESAEEREMIERAAEMRILEALVHAERLNRYTPEHFTRGVVYGEGKHSVVYRADAQQGKEEEEGARPGFTEVTETARAMATMVMRDAVAGVRAAVVALTVDSASATSAAVTTPEHISTIFAASVSACAIDAGVASILSRAPAMTKTKTFAAKEFRYTRSDPPVPILQHAGREIRMHLRLRYCKGVVALRGVWLTPRVTLLLEPMGGGTLHRFIRERREEAQFGKDGEVRETDACARRAALLVAEVADSLAALHMAGIVHRDVKTHNVMMVRRSFWPMGKDPVGPGCGYDVDDSRGNAIGRKRHSGRESELEAKVGDLGSAALIPLEGEAALTEEIGTSGWVAPEVLSGEGYGTKADIFSLGVLAWETFVGGTLSNPMCGLSGEAYSSALRAGVRPHLPVSVPTVVQGLVVRCWAFDPGGRPTADEVAAELRAYATGAVYR